MSGTLREALRAATADLARAGIEGAARDARRLVALATGRDPSRLALEPDAAVSPEARAALERLVARRCARVPLSHLTGRRAFWTHDFRVTPDVLDPRPETEMVVAAALAAPFERVLDLGTGSGAIVLSLLAERPGAAGLGTDISAAALDVARANAADLGLSARVEWRLSDWFAAVSERFDLIVSNPPYLAEAEMAGLAPELAHEPRHALTDGADGLDAYRVIARGAPERLRDGGRLICEIGPSQGAAVAALFARAGLRDVAVGQDLDGRDRIVSGCRGGGTP